MFRGHTFDYRWLDIDACDTPVTYTVLYDLAPRTFTIRSLQEYFLTKWCLCLLKGNYDMNRCYMPVVILSV